MPVSVRPPLLPPLLAVLAFAMVPGLAHALDKAPRLAAAQASVADTSGAVSAPLNGQPGAAGKLSPAAPTNLFNSAGFGQAAPALAPGFSPALLNRVSAVSVSPAAINQMSGIAASSLARSSLSFRVAMQALAAQKAGIRINLSANIPASIAFRAAFGRR